MDSERIVASRDILNHDDPAQLAWAAIAPLWRVVNLNAAPEALRTQLQQLSPGQRALYAVDRCTKDVRNGGFEQFFANRSGNVAVEALEGFRLIRAERYAQILERAFAVFPEGVPPRDRELRVELLATIMFGGNDDDELQASPFDEFDDAFFKLLRSDDLEHYRARYVRGHPGEFVDM